jgi:hypothetical protein
MVLTKGPMLETKVLSANMALVKGILAYTAVCIKNYKS